LLEAQAFVLCPAGVPLGKSPEHGYFYRNHHELEREVLAGVEALRAAYPEALDPGPFVYAAYSQGATMGALMLAAHGALFDRLVLVEGGYGEWTMSSAQRFAASGGQRVLFACGITTCKAKAELSARALTRAGIATRVVHAAGGGHTYGGRVADELRGALPFLLEGDARWP
jgi:pimeloyl-ACP methyl ester carboxylesterase